MDGKRSEFNRKSKQWYSIYVAWHAFSAIMKRSGVSIELYNKL